MTLSTVQMALGQIRIWVASNKTLDELVQGICAAQIDVELVQPIHNLTGTLTAFTISWRIGSAAWCGVYVQGKPEGIYLVTLLQQFQLLRRLLRHLSAVLAEAL